MFILNIAACRTQKWRQTPSPSLENWIEASRLRRKRKTNLITASDSNNAKMTSLIARTDCHHGDNTATTSTSKANTHAGAAVGISPRTSSLPLFFQQLLFEFLNVVPQFGILHHQFLLFSDTGLDHCSGEKSCVTSQHWNFSVPQGRS